MPETTFESQAPSTYIQPELSLESPKPVVEKTLPPEIQELLNAKEEEIRQLKLQVAELTKQKDEAIELAGRDPLTEILNRRGGEERMETYLSQVARGDIKLAYCRVDIDHFKKVNDEKGHLWGDEVLKAFAKKINGIKRDSDLFFRYGGEEFDLVLSFDKDTPMHVIGAAVGRYLKEIRTLSRSPESSNDLTASFGVSIIEKGESFELTEIQTQADAALYQAKQRGRDRIIVNHANDLYKNPADIFVWEPAY